MAEVREVYTQRRRARLWPSVVMLLVVLLLIGVIVAMIMNVRGSVTWPAGGVEFGFRPHMYINRTQAADAAAPTRVAIDVGASTETAVEDAASRGDAAATVTPEAEVSAPVQEQPSVATPPADPLAPTE